MMCAPEWTLAPGLTVPTVEAMTTTTTDLPTTDIPVRLDIDTVAPGLTNALTHLGHAATRELDRADIDARLRELLRIRVSQLNGCAYCVDMHSTDARAVGETEQRLTGLPVWRETPYFTAAERAALGYAESVALMTADHVPDEVHAQLAEHYDEAGIAALLGLVVSITAWNAVGVSTRAWQVGSYQP